MSNTKLVSVNPRTKLAESLISSNYPSEKAIADLIDNSFDAESDNVRLEFRNDKIIIADDGYGMDLETLSEALAIGSETEKDKSSQLGRFGMGLNTASLSLGRRFKVITKEAMTDSVYTGIFDVDNIIERKNWDIPIDISSDEDKSVLLNYIFLSDYKDDLFSQESMSDEQLFHEGSGTVVIIEKIHDNISTSYMKEKLPKYLGRIFRNFIDNNKNIKILKNKTFVKLESIDPLEREYDKTQIWYDEDVEIDEKYPTIKLRIAYLDKNNPNIKIPHNIIHQGVYFVRNNRELLSGDKFFDIWNAKHNQYNELRVEIVANGDHDELFCLTFDKTALKDLKQSAIDKLKKIINPYLNRAISISRQNVKSDKKNNELDKKVINDINKHKSILDLPTSRKNSRKFKGRNKNGKRNEDKNTGNRHKKNGNNDKVKDICRFEYASLGRGSALFIPEQEDVLVITFNTDHPFFREYIDIESSKGKKDEDYYIALRYIFFSFASAQVTYTPESQEQELILNVMNTASNNLRSLMC